jgi:hypothetical protein
MGPAASEKVSPASEQEGHRPLALNEPLPPSLGLAEPKIDADKVNVNGGAIASATDWRQRRAHPSRCSTPCASVRWRWPGRLHGGGQGIAMVVERAWDVGERAATGAFFDVDARC